MTGCEIVRCYPGNTVYYWVCKYDAFVRRIVIKYATGEVDEIVLPYMV